MDPLTQLHAVSRQIEDQRALTELRDRLIVEARAAGASWKDIAEASGLAYQTVRNIGQKAKNCD